MKTAFRFLCLIIAGFALSSCLLEPEPEYIRSSDYYHPKVYHAIFDALESGNKADLKKLFSTDAKNKIEDFDTRIDEIFEFVEGKQITRRPYLASPGERRNSDSGNIKMTLESVNDFDLGGETYSMQFIWYISNIRSEKALQGISVILISKYLGWNLPRDNPGIYIQ